MEKKQLSLIYRIILLALLGIFTVVSMFSVAKVNVNLPIETNDTSWGIVLAGIQTPNDISIEFGLVPTIKSVIPLVRNAQNVGIVFRAAFSDEPQDKTFRQAIEQVWEDEECAQAICKFFGSLYLYINPVSNFEPDEDGGISKAELIMGIFGMFSIILLSGMAWMMPIYILIKYFSFLVKNLKGIESECDEVFESRIDIVSFLTNTTIAFLGLYMVSSIGIRNLQMGIAIWGALILYILVSLLRCARLVLLTDENRKIVLVKQVISIVTIIAVIILLLNFSGLDIIRTFQDEIENMTLLHYLGVLEETGSASNAEDATATTNILYAIAISIVVYLSMIMLVAVMNNGIERTAGMKARRGELVPYRPMIKTAVFILAVAMIPLFITVDSEEKIEEAYETGHFKIWYTEYKEEGTIENLRYEAFTEYIEECNEEIEKLKEELTVADGEKADELSVQIKQAESDVQAVRRQLREIENKPTRISISLIAAIILLLSEIAYAVVLKKSSSQKKVILIENQ